MIRGSVVRVSCVRAQEAKDAVVKSSVLVVIDFGDAAVPANKISNKRPCEVLLIWRKFSMQRITQKNYEVTERKHLGDV